MGNERDYRANTGRVLPSCVLIESLITSTIKCQNSTTMHGLSYHVAVFGKRSHECASSLINKTECYLRARQRQNDKQCFVESMIMIKTEMKRLGDLCLLIAVRFYPEMMTHSFLFIHYAAAVSPMQHFLMSWLPDRSRLNATVEIITEHPEIYHEAYHWSHRKDGLIIQIMSWLKTKVKLTFRGKVRVQVAFQMSHRDDSCSEWSVCWSTVWRQRHIWHLKVEKKHI